MPKRNFILEQEDEADPQILAILNERGLRQYSLTWILEDENGPKYKRAEPLIFREGPYEQDQRIPTDFLHIPEGYAPLYPQQIPELWTRFCSLADGSNLTSAVVRHQEQETTFSTPRPFTQDLRIRVDYSELLNLEEVAQVVL